MGGGGQIGGGYGIDSVHDDTDDMSKAVVYIDPDAKRPFYLKDKAHNAWILISQFGLLDITKVMMMNMSADELDVVIKMLYLRKQQLVEQEAGNAERVQEHGNGQNSVKEPKQVSDGSGTAMEEQSKETS